MKLPADSGAEWGVLSAVCFGAGAGVERLTPDLFADPDALKVASWMTAQHEDKRPIDDAIVAHQLGTEILTRLNESCGPSLENLMPILREKRALRGLQSFAFDINRSVTELEPSKLAIAPDIRRSIAEAIDSLHAIRQSVDDTRRHSMADNLNELIVAMEASRNGKAPPRVPTGVPGLDRLLAGGLRPAEVAILGARTSVGKSALACWIAKAACAAGRRVLFVSREMQKLTLLERILTAESGTRIGAADDGEHQRRAVVSALSRMNKWPLTILDDIKTVQDIAAEVKSVKPDLVVIDHIGIIDSGLGPKASAYDRATAASNAIRDLALEERIAALVLCQVNRAGVSDDAPRLDHLKGSGILEEDCRVAVILHRTEELADGTQALTLSLAKNTSGPCGLIKLRFDPARCTFSEDRPMPDPHAR